MRLVSCSKYDMIRVPVATDCVLHEFDILCDELNNARSKIGNQCGSHKIKKTEK